jgi:hypothetical protein
VAPSLRRMGAEPSQFEVDRAALISFRERSGRFLFARQADGDLSFLEQGTANHRRVETRPRLRCPDPGCPSPEVTTVSRMPGGARDGFRHLVAPTGGHDAESMFHRQAKALVQRWASGVDGVAAAETEVRLHSGERVADVLLTLRGGARLAVEIQYCALSVDDWLNRTASYRRLGIPVAWLWGHFGAQSPLRERWRALAQRQAQATEPVLWVNPSEEQIAWTWDLGGLDQPPVEPRRPQYKLGALIDLEIRPSGLFPPGFREAVALRCQEVDEAERQRQADKERQRRRRAERDAARERFYARDDSPPGARHTFSGPVKEPTQGKGRCRRCGGALDPSLTSGFHVDLLCHLA